MQRPRDKYTRAVSRQRLSKNIPAATDTHATIEVLLETVFSTRSVQRGYKEDNCWRQDESSRKRGRPPKDKTVTVKQ
jgi:hypothetical protein